MSCGDAIGLGLIIKNEFAKKQGSIILVEIGLEREISSMYYFPKNVDFNIKYLKAEHVTFYDRVAIMMT